MARMSGAELRICASTRMPLAVARPAAAASSAFGTTPMPTITILAGDALAGRGDDGRDMAVFAFEPLDRGARQDADAGAGEPLPHMRRDRRRDGPAEQPVLRLDHRDAAAAGGSVAAISRPMKPPPRMTTSSTCAGEFADRRGRRRSSAATARRRAAALDAAGRAAASRWQGSAWSKASCRRRRAPAAAPAGSMRSTRSPSRRSIDRAGIEGLGAQDLRLGRGVLDEGLGQRRLVVGQFVLVADQRDRAVKPSSRRLAAACTPACPAPTMTTPFFMHRFLMPCLAPLAAVEIVRERRAGARSGSHPARRPVKRAARMPAINMTMLV